MIREDCYYRLRELGVSVEVADEKAPILAELTERQREAIFLTIQGYSQREAGGIMGISHERVGQLCRSVVALPKDAEKSVYII